MANGFESRSAPDQGIYLSVVIPCLNEHDAIHSVMDRFLQFKTQMESLEKHAVELIVVDDHSTDGSAEIVSQFAFATLLRNPGPRGYGTALKFGCASARGRFIAFYDMDNTYDPLDILPMLELLEAGADMISGDRLSQLSHMPLMRKIGNRLFVTVTEMLLRTRVEDCCSGLRVFRREVSAELFHFLPDQLNFTLALTIACLVRNYKLIEVPIRYGRRFGPSKLKILIDGPRFLLTIFRYWLW